MVDPDGAPPSATRIMMDASSLQGGLFLARIAARRGEWALRSPAGPADGPGPLAGTPYLPVPRRGVGPPWLALGSHRSATSPPMATDSGPRWGAVHARALHRRGVRPRAASGVPGVHTAHARPAIEHSAAGAYSESLPAGRRGASRPSAKAPSDPETPVERDGS